MNAPVLQKKDYRSDQEVRWCPGCGDYAILNAVTQVFAELQMSREKTVIISGIGCSSRFPYYLSTYGFHTIHGRAPTIATGVKLANPDLDVWVVTGDGDAMSIGGNHLIHALRRNVNLKILMFNNRIYGLTKGQFSPTSEQGKVTKSSPMGALDRPFNPLALALGSGATFVARTGDVLAKHMPDVLKAAAQHQGAAFVEIMQNCNIFNDEAWDHLVEKDVRDDRLVDLRPGKPVRFGKNLSKGVRLRGLELETFDVTPANESECITWDPTAPNPAIAFMIAHFVEGVQPTPIGIFRDISVAPFDHLVHDQIAAARAKKGEGDLAKLIDSGDVWDVTE
ncbi:MAG TPA: 2-oxoacid:ferredoxin oxidoreductase subunit beta [Planctomycetota bacterium]|nr:2-oxoacid:ferredoxin oxidoreductase subunit beta [Planctomycetota bacterium]